MKMRILLCSFISALVAFGLVSCGFGGFSGSDTGGATPAGSSPVETAVSGTAAKGVLRKGTVQIYAVNSDGSVGNLLQTTTTDAGGHYSVKIHYRGTLLVKAFGEYLDEATGQILTIPASKPLRAAVTAAPETAMLTIAVTPLTELAVRQAGNLLTETSINAANTLLSDLFKVDIINTQPLEFTATTFDSAYSTQEEKEYTLVLAAISQLASKDADSDSDAKLQNTLNSISKDITGGIMSAQTAGSIMAALVEFLGSVNNISGINDVNQTNLCNLGGSVRVVRLSTVVSAGVISMKGLNATVNLPAGVTLRADFTTGKTPTTPIGGFVMTSGVTPTTQNTLFGSSYTPPDGTKPAAVTIALSSDVPILTGEFALLRCDFPVVPPQPDFTFSNFAVFNDNGAEIPGVSFSASVD